MKLCIKTFDELSTRELYEILRVRSEVFVIEQQCNYQDMDGQDFDSLHIYLEDDGRIVAYLRAFSVEDNAVRLGRVLTTERGKGYGGRLLSESISAVRKRFNPEKICIESQTHAIGFYEREGFAVCSEEFLDVGIPHKRMELNFGFERE